MIQQTSRALHVDPKDAVPIWRQIEEGVRRLVARGALRPGGPVPSVRELASDLGVNPATVAKAYQRLTDAGILVVKRGEGTFVSDAPPALARGERKRALGEAALRYATAAVTLDVPRGDAVAAVEDALTALDGDRK